MNTAFTVSQAYNMLQEILCEMIVSFRERFVKLNGIANSNRKKSICEPL